MHVRPCWWRPIATPLNVILQSLQPDLTMTTMLPKRKGSDAYTSGPTLVVLQCMVNNLLAAVNLVY